VLKFTVNCVGAFGGLVMEHPDGKEGVLTVAFFTFSGVGWFMIAVVRK
jgi:hypothetical protein